MIDSHKKRAVIFSMTAPFKSIAMIYYLRDF